jgi:hypothetical protein
MFRLRSFFKFRICAWLLMKYTKGPKLLPYYNRASARQQKNQSPAVAANFEVGEFVLVAKRELRGGEKLGVKWNGPQRIVGTRSDHVYEVEDITTSVVTHVHSTRLCFYHKSSLEITAEIQAHLAHQKSSDEVSAFRDHWYDAESKSYYVLVSWVSFEESATLGNLYRYSTRTYQRMSFLSCTLLQTLFSLQTLEVCFRNSTLLSKRGVLPLCGRACMSKYLTALV